MRQLLISLTLLAHSFAAELSYQGHVDIQSQAYLNHPQKKHSNNFTASTQLEVTYARDSFESIVKLSAQQDYHDLQSSSDHNDRSFIRLDEFYGKYDFSDAQIMAGKSIRFWGALEADNIVDAFNPDDLRSDLFDADKLGVWNLSYTYYTDTGELALILKVHEQDQAMPANPYVYYFFPAFVNYDKDLRTKKSKNRPSVYLQYSGSTESENPLDYALIFEHGYDSQRYFISDGPLNGSPVNFNTHAYLVNKLMSYNTLVIGSTLFKLEALYTDVIDEKKISDYYHLGVGVEHTLAQFHDQADLGLIAEYYKYNTLDDEKFSDLDLFEVFQNDLFLGLRYSFNQGNDSTLIGGAIFDMDYNEQSYYLEYESRLAETFKLNLDYRYIEPSQNSLTAFHLMRRHQRLSLKLGYYF